MRRFNVNTVIHRQSKACDLLLRIFLKRYGPWKSSNKN